MLGKNSLKKISKNTFALSLLAYKLVTASRRNSQYSYIAFTKLIYSKELLSNDL